MKSPGHTFKKRLSLKALISFLALSPSVVCAQGFGEDEDALIGLYGDEEMISIATGNSQPISKAPAVATVITAAQIEAMGATDIDEVLETVPGLHVARNALGYLPIYVFRGIYEQYNPQVLMLINGIPITNLFHGDRNLAWGGMPVKAISRIEVIRGPGSAVYGADAFAGVINIITKTYDDIPETEVGVRRGSFSTNEAWLLTSEEFNFGRFALALELSETDGQQRTIQLDAQSINDWIAGTNASNAPGSVNLARQNGDLRVDWQYEHFQARIGYQYRDHNETGAGVAEALDPYGYYKSERLNADLTYHNQDVADNWDLSAQVSYFSTSQEKQNDLYVFPAGVSFGPGLEFPEGMIGNPEVFERHYRFEASAFYSGIALHSLRVGVGYANNIIHETRETKNYTFDPTSGAPVPVGSIIDVSDTPAVFLPEDNRENAHIYLQDIWNFAQDWELTAGVRFDDYTDFGSTTNPRAALVWSATQNLTVKWLYSKAFRAPSFAESRAINNPVVLGNPDLDPEVIKSYEMAFDYQPSSSLRVGLNIFDYSWSDIIIFVPQPGSPPSNLAQNVGRNRGRGAEVEINYKLNERASITSNFSWVKAEDERRDADAPNAPNRQFYLAGNFAIFDSLHAHLYFNWVMDRERYALDPRDEIDDYRDSGINLRYTADSWKFGIKVRNLFDTDQREPSLGIAIPYDLPLAGRNYLVEVSTTF